MDWLLTIILSLLAGERTTYAPGFDEARFRALSRGTSQTDVISRLGEPLDRHRFASGNTLFRYSTPQSARDNYLVRNVVFDRNGRIVAKQAEFYFD
jgi:hypothetical protein